MNRLNGLRYLGCLRRRVDIAVAVAAGVRLVRLVRQSCVSHCARHLGVVDNRYDSMGRSMSVCTLRCLTCILCPAFLRCLSFLCDRLVF